MRSIIPSQMKKYAQTGVPLMVGQVRHPIWFRGCYGWAATTNAPAPSGWQQNLGRRLHSDGKLINWVGAPDERGWLVLNALNH
jgi:hypothetical protein